MRCRCFRVGHWISCAVAEAVVPTLRCIASTVRWKRAKGPWRSATRAKGSSFDALGRSCRLFQGEFSGNCRTFWHTHTSIFTFIHDTYQWLYVYLHMLRYAYREMIGPVVVMRYRITVCFAWANVFNSLLPGFRNSLIQFEWPWFDHVGPLVRLGGPLNSQVQPARFGNHAGGRSHWKYAAAP